MTNQINSAHPQTRMLSPKENVPSLPDELCLKIFSYLAPWDMKWVAQVCKQWHRCAEEPELWKLFHKKIKSQVVSNGCLFENCNLFYVDKNNNDISQLRKTITTYYNKKINSNFFKDVLRAHLVDFKENPQEFFAAYVKNHREKIILNPEYLLSLMDQKIKWLEFQAKDFLNLYIDLNEEELIFRWSVLLSITHDYDIIEHKTVIKWGVNDILKRILEKKSYTLVAAHLHKCYYLKFQDKYQFIQIILSRIKELPWMQQHRIITTLKTNLPLDINLSIEEYDQISKLLVVEECEPKKDLPVIRYPEESPRSFKVASYAMTFFKTSCLLVCGLAACALFSGFTNPYYTPLLLKVVAASGVCFIGMLSVSKVVERYSSSDINGLIIEALKSLETSETYLIWRQKLIDTKFLTPLVYKSCEQAKIPYKSLDYYQSPSDVFALFYAIHFAIDHFTSEFQLNAKDKLNLIKMIKFLEEWRFDLLNEIFIKRDNFYENPSFFKQKYRQNIANLRTREALQIYQIKKEARKIGLEFPEVTPSISDYNEKLEAMANEIQGCTDITEWLQKLEEKKLLTDLLQLAQFNLPPNYRCVGTGKLLTSAVSTQGTFFNIGIVNEKLKAINTIDHRNRYEYEVETSSDIIWAIITVFLEYFHRNKFIKSKVSINIKINDCLRFLDNHFNKEIDKIRFQEIESLEYEWQRLHEMRRFFEKRRWYFGTQVRPSIYDKNMRLDE